MKVRIRRAGPEDAADIFGLLYFNALAENSLGADGFSPEKAMLTIRRLIPTTLLAVSGEEIVGVLMMEITDLWYSSSKFMVDVIFFVRKDARNSTAAARLVRGAIRSGKSAELPVVLQQSSGEDMLRKDRFYERMGGRRLGGMFIFED